MPRHLLQPLPRAFAGHRELSGRRSGITEDGMWEKLDRCQVLGNSTEGHRGCVNALSWSDNGSTLLSGSDDNCICIWTSDTSSLSSSPHPMKLVDVIATGHRGNIFSAKFLPNTSSPTIVSCAGDNGVRVFDVERLGRAELGRGMGVRDELSGFDGPGTRVLRCHTDRTKRISTENSPFLFLTVSEDGTVRQHDLRRPHNCRSECPEPLFRAPRGIDLYSLSVSTVTPHMFAVAGRTDCAYLCDRRMVERQTPSWGRNIQSSEQVHCVRRLGMTQGQWDKYHPRNSFSSERHITCVKMSPHNADEVICAFAGHSVGIFSIYDSLGPSSMRRNSTSRSPSPVADPPAGIQSDRQSNNPAAAFLIDGSGHRPVKRRQSALSTVAMNPAPTQRQRSQEQTNRQGLNEADELEAGPSTAPRAFRHGSESGDETSSTTSSERRYLLSRQSRQPVTSAEALRILIDDVGLPVEDESIGVGVSPDADGADGEQIREDMHELLYGGTSSSPGPASRGGTGMELDPGLPDMETLTELNDILVDMEDEDEDEDEDGDDDDDVDEDDVDDFDFDPMDLMEQPRRTTVFDDVDMITPRRCYRGAKNIETVKDCNFLGTRSDKVCSGSDDGHFFVWDKGTGKLEGIWEGDSSVVNVMEQHPTLPLLAVSGIDSNVKLFAPLAQRPDPSFARLHLRESITKANNEARSYLDRAGFANVSLMEFLAQRGIRVTHADDADGEPGPQCPTQ